MQGFCISCRKHVDVIDPAKVPTGGRAPTFKGQCPVCGHDVYRIGKSPTTETPVVLCTRPLGHVGQHEHNPGDNYVDPCKRPVTPTTETE